MESFLVNSSEFSWWLVYLAVFVGMVFEGEIILLVSGFLVKAGGIDFFIVLFFAVCGSVLHDIVYWSIGRWLKKKSKKKFLFFSLEKRERFLEKIKRNSGFYIFVSKLTYGTNRLTLLASGYLNVTFKTLAKYSAPASVIWAMIVISLGYFLADRVSFFKGDIRLILLSFAGLFAVIFLFGRILHKIFIKNKNRNSENV